MLYFLQRPWFVRVLLWPADSQMKEKAADYLFHNYQAWEKWKAMGVAHLIAIKLFSTWMQWKLQLSLVAFWLMYNYKREVEQL